MFDLIHRGIQSVRPLKVLYTSHPDIPVHSDTNSPSLGSININLAVSTARKLFTHVFPPLHIAKYSFIQLRGRGVENITNSASLCMDPEGYRLQFVYGSDSAAN